MPAHTALCTLPLLGFLFACTNPAATPPAAPLIAEPENELGSTPAAASARMERPLDNTPVLQVTASRGDASAPQAVTDGNLATHWSHYGHDAWLQADLGEVRTLQSVQVAWHRGDVRYNRFSVSVSTDGVKFHRVFSGLSSGKSVAPERYTFRALPGRFVRLSVEGNSENAWTSVSELSVQATPWLHATAPHHAH